MPPPECIVCRENYNNNENQPLLLPCCHTLCRSCVNRSVKNGKIKNCSGCAGSHDSVVVEQLKVNYSMLAVSFQSSSCKMEASTSQSQGSTIQIILKTLDGRSNYSLKVFPSTTIREVKAVIKNQYGFQPGNTRLLFGGTTLKDPRSLSSYNIKEGTTLQMSTSYHGG